MRVMTALVPCVTDVFLESRLCLTKSLVNTTVPFSLKRSSGPHSVSLDCRKVHFVAI